MNTQVSKQGSKNIRRNIKNLLLLLTVVFIAVVPLMMVKDSEFGGTDDKAKDAISEINSNYKPWFSPIINLPGEETESLLFALQAAIGAGVIGYCIGYMRGKTAGKE